MGDGADMSDDALLRRLHIRRHRADQRVGTGRCRLDAHRDRRRGSRAVQPAITGTRQDAASATVCTARAYSDGISEAASPVLPQTIRQAVPRSICRSERRDRAVQSMRVSRNGVTSAVDEPPTPSMGLCIVMDSSQADRRRPNDGTSALSTWRPAARTDLHGRQGIDADRQAAARTERVADCGQGGCQPVERGHLRHDHQAGAACFQPSVGAEMGRLWRACPQQCAHQVGAVAAENDDVLFVLDRAEAVEQRGPRLWRLQRKAGQRATWRDRRTGVRQHGRLLRVKVMCELEVSRVIAGRKIGARAYNLHPSRGRHV
jgi:hypothetical protein